MTQNTFPVFISLSPVGLGYCFCFDGAFFFFVSCIFSGVNHFNTIIKDDTGVIINTIQSQETYCQESEYSNDGRDLRFDDVNGL